MTSASLQAEALHEALGATRAEDMHALSDGMRKRLPRLLWLPWFLATTLDLHYPKTRGERPFGHGLLMWYVTNLLELTSTSSRIYKNFATVLSLRAGLWHILKPTVALPVLAHGVKALFVPLAKRGNTNKLLAPLAPRRVT